MKLLLGLLVSLAISSAFALPARSPKDEVDVVEVPQGPQQSLGRETGTGTENDETDVDPDFKNFKGFVDTGAGYPFLAPLPRPFSFNLGFFDSFDDIFRGLRNRLWAVDADSSSDESNEDGTFGLGSSPINDTTSVVKVVDGHKIEINETVIGNGDGSGGAVFKFRIINIRPLESGEEVSEGTQTSIPKTESQNTPTTHRDIEGNSEETKNSDENEINANVEDPESTTEAITTEMLDKGVPSLDNNAIDNDSAVKLDELQEDSPTTEGLADVEVVATLNEDTPNLAGDTIKSEQLSEPVDPENVNEEGIETTSSSSEEQSTPKDDSNDEIIESTVVNQNTQESDDQEVREVIAENQTEAVDDSVLAAIDVDKMMSIKDQEEEEEELEVATQEPYNQYHSLREDVSSSDDEDDEQDNSRIEGLDSEWGGSSLDDKNILTNEIDVYESVPIDLSNDIAINDIMADQGVPVNPDAELFDVEKLTSGAIDSKVEGARRFEVLADIK